VPGRIYEVRFPNGDFELDAGSQNPPPSVGDTIRRRGQLWTVTERSEAQQRIVVRVTPHPDKGR